MRTVGSQIWSHFQSVIILLRFLVFKVPTLSYLLRKYRTKALKRRCQRGRRGVFFYYYYCAQLSAKFLRDSFLASLGRNWVYSAQKGHKQSRQQDLRALECPNIYCTTNHTSFCALVTLVSFVKDSKRPQSASGFWQRTATQYHRVRVLR